MSAKKDFGNLVYHADLVSGLSLGYNMAAKRLIKMKPVGFGNPDLEDSVKLVACVALAMWTQDLLIKQGLPHNIIKTV